MTHPAPQPLRVEMDRGADEPLIDMIVNRPNQPHITYRSPGHYWVDLPVDVHVTVKLASPRSGHRFPHYVVTTWRNAYDRERGDQ